MSDTEEMTRDLTLQLQEHQIKLEQLYAKNQLIPRLMAEFQASDMGFAEGFTEHGIPHQFGWDLIVQMALHKRADVPTIVGLLYHHFNDAQLTADMVLRAVDVDLVDWDPRGKMLVTCFNIANDVQAELDRFQYPLPMVMPPQTIETNRTSGYLINNSSVILKKNHHNEDVCLDHLNTLNQVKLSINAECVKMLHNKWKALDKKKPEETQDKYLQRKRAFLKYDRVAHDVIDILTEHGNEFYLTHKYDKRGRTYSCGYHVNYQGNPWNKAVIEFTDKELVT